MPDLSSMRELAIRAHKESQQEHPGLPADKEVLANIVLAALDTPKAKRAHTYASENADRYLGFEDGWNACRDAVHEAMLRAMKGESE